MFSTSSRTWSLSRIREDRSGNGSDHLDSSRFFCEGVDIDVSRSSPSVTELERARRRT
jgi:hypothetical protein